MIPSPSAYECSSLQLDEVFDASQRETVVTEIIRFSIENPNVRIMVTSRIIGFSPKPFIDAGFRHFTLQDFDYPRQVRHFIKKWYKYALPDPQEQGRLISRLYEAIDCSPAIRQLSGNPLLLSMMAILNRNQDLPIDRYELYNESSNVLIHNWDIEKNLPKDEKIEPDTIGLKEKQALLRKVAYYIQTVSKNKGGNYIESEELETVICNYLKSIEEIDKPKRVANLITQQLRERNFILCYWGADHYAFVHRTFLEYFCAQEYLWQFEKTRSIDINELKTSVFGKHWNDDSWHEVLRLIVAMINEKYAAELIEYIIKLKSEHHENLFFAGQLLSEVKNRTLIRTIDQELMSLLKKLIHYSVPDTNYERDPFSNSPGLYQEDDICSIVRSNAIKTIAKLWGNKKETEEFLNNLSNANYEKEMKDIKETAIGELKRIRDNKRGRATSKALG